MQVVLRIALISTALAALGMVGSDVVAPRPTEGAGSASWRSGTPRRASATSCKKKKRKAAPRRTTKPEAEPEAAPSPTSNLVPATQFRGPTRIDFDDRLIQGQTNKSGAVYLFDRKESGISSMVKRRKSFRQLTLRTVYDR